MSLKLPSSILDQDGDSDAKQYESSSGGSSGFSSARGQGSGLFSAAAVEFTPNTGNGGFMGVYGNSGVWNPNVDNQNWPTEGSSNGRPRSASRSAPTTPRVFEWGSSMAYSTAPVSPHQYGPGSGQRSPNDMGTIPLPQQPHQMAPMMTPQLRAQTAPAQVQQHLAPHQQGPPPHQAYGGFPSTPDLVYSAPGAFGVLGDDEDDQMLPKQAEHPSRTLFVRNLANDTDPLALQSEFEQFGPVRSIYANCKYRGFVMISFFDIRHAKAAMLVLNGKKVLGKKMDIHYALPKDNPGERESNQGTLVVFNLDTSMSDDDIRAVFAEHGEVKDIRSTPNKNTHKFVEFFDVRDAERALLAPTE